MKAMILAAGLGTRLRPYTEHCPKPLFPILDRPLLLRQLDLLRQHGFGPFVVNAHHLHEHFIHLLSAVEDVTLQVEETILGTGGGLRKALPLLGSEPILVINGDILHTYELSSIISRHNQSGCSVSLVVHDFPRFNNVLVSTDDRISAFRQDSGTNIDHDLLAFTGIQVIDPSVLHEIPADSYYDIIDLYKSLLDSGSSDISAIRVGGGFWTDIGTPADYLEVHKKLLTRSAPHDLQKMFPNVNGPVVIMPGSEIGSEVTFDDWAFVGSGVNVGKGAKITRSVVWDGAEVENGALIEDDIVVS